jgi:hypothetical protein
MMAETWHGVGGHVHRDRAADLEADLEACRDEREVRERRWATRMIALRKRLRSYENELSTLKVRTSVYIEPRDEKLLVELRTRTETLRTTIEFLERP